MAINVLAQGLQEGVGAEHHLLAEVATASRQEALQGLAFLIEETATLKDQLSQIEGREDLQDQLFLIEGREDLQDLLFLTEGKVAEQELSQDLPLVEERKHQEAEMRLERHKALKVQVSKIATKTKVIRLLCDWRRLLLSFAQCPK